MEAGVRPPLEGGLPLFSGPVDVEAARFVVEMSLVSLQLAATHSAKGEAGGSWWERELVAAAGGRFMVGNGFVGQRPVGRLLMVVFVGRSRHGFGQIVEQML